MIDIDYFMYSAIETRGVTADIDLCHPHTSKKKNQHVAISSQNSRCARRDYQSIASQEAEYKYGN